MAGGLTPGQGLLVDIPPHWACWRQPHLREALAVEATQCDPCRGQDSCASQGPPRWDVALGMWQKVGRASLQLNTLSPLLTHCQSMLAISILKKKTRLGRGWVPALSTLRLAYLKCCRGGVPAWGAGHRQAQVTDGAVRGEQSRRQRVSWRAEDRHAGMAEEVPFPGPQGPAHTHPGRWALHRPRCFPGGLGLRPRSSNTHHCPPRLSGQRSGQHLVRRSRVRAPWGRRCLMWAGLEPPRWAY